MTLTDSTLRTYLTAPLVVLALWEPWAILCVAPDPEHDGQPAKVHETRHWFPTGTLPFAVAIHAAKKFDKYNREQFTAPRFREALKRSGFYPGDPRPFLERKLAPPAGLRPVPLGAIVGLATVASYVSTGIVGTPVPHFAGADEDDRAFGDFSPSRFAWRLRDTVLLPEPIPHTGRQDALYPLDLTTRETINAQLRRLAA